VFFSRKQKAVETLIARYLDCVEECLACLAACLDSALSGAPYEQILEQAQATHRAESRADDTRREAAILLYGKALFPESRSDLLRILEGVDRVANAADSVARRIRFERTAIPADLRADYRELLLRVQPCAEEMIKAVRMLFSDYNAAVHVSDRVGDLESRADLAEFRIIERVFASDLDTGHKILLRDLAVKIGDIADRAESAADHVRITAIKRTV
jgi:hypothetical protein